MAIPLSTVEDLARFTGRTVVSYGVLGDFVAEAISQSTLLFSLATGLTDLPANLADRQLAINAILEMADKIYRTRLYSDVTEVPFQSESIGSYSYSKLVTKVKNNQDTGLMWFDMAVDRLSAWDTGDNIWSTGVSVFERDGMVRVGRHRWIPGPAAYNELEAAHISRDPSYRKWYVGEGDAVIEHYPASGGSIDSGGDDDDEVFTFYQNEPSSEWVINHFLGGEPDVNVIDNLGETIGVEVNHVDDNTLKILAWPPVAGTARLTLVKD